MKRRGDASFPCFYFSLLNQLLIGVLGFWGFVEGGHVRSLKRVRRKKKKKKRNMYPRVVFVHFFIHSLISVN